MNISFYSLYDTKLERYNLPYTARNDQEAITILIRSGIPKTIYEDIKLYRMADFNDEDNTKENSLVSYSSKVEVKLPPFPLGGVE